MMGQTRPIRPVAVLSQLTFVPHELEVSINGSDSGTYTAVAAPSVDGRPLAMDEDVG